MHTGDTELQEKERKAHPHFFERLTRYDYFRDVRAGPREDLSVGRRL